MSRRHPLSLTTSELKIVMDAALVLHPNHRQSFLTAIADELTERRICEDTVRHAVDVVLKRLLVQPDQRNEVCT